MLVIATGPQGERLGIRMNYITEPVLLCCISLFRYSDFMVHEIALDGSLVQLTNLTPPVLVCYIIS